MRRKKRKKEIYRGDGDGQGTDGGDKIGGGVIKGSLHCVRTTRTDEGAANLSGNKIRLLEVYEENAVKKKRTWGHVKRVQGQPSP